MKMNLMNCRTPGLLFTLLLFFLFLGVNATRVLASNPPALCPNCEKNMTNGIVPNSGECGICDKDLREAKDRGGGGCQQTLCECFCDADWPEGSGSDAVTIQRSVTVETGSEYRKISVKGTPLPDEKPQAEGESDYNTEETYVDAYTLNLNHEVSDIFVPGASGHLNLQVRRGVQQDQFGLGNKLFGVFGPCWNSNLDCSLIIKFNVETNDINPEGCRTFSSSDVTIIDENGRKHTFYSPSDNVYSPAPSQQTSVDAAFQTLVENEDGFVFTKRHGTTLFFSGNISTTVVELVNQYGLEAVYDPDDSGIQIYPASDTQVYEVRKYYQASYVQDRHGMKLVYDYPTTNSLVPCEIKLLNADEERDAVSNLKITVSMNEYGLVDSVVDPNGNITEYDYGNWFSYYNQWGPGEAFSYEDYGDDREFGPYTANSPHYALVSVRRPSVDEIQSSTEYEYGFFDKRVINRDCLNGYFGVFVESITDANKNRYDFQWTPNQSFCISSNSDRREWGENGVTNSTPNGEYTVQPDIHLPMQLCSISNLNRAVSFSYIDDLGIDALNLDLGLHDLRDRAQIEPLSIVEGGKVTVEVLDIESKLWSYVYSNPVSVVSLKSYYSDSAYTHYDAFMFERMDIKDCAGRSQSVFYDIDAGMALSKSIDYSSNTNSFGHNDRANYAALGQEGYNLEDKLSEYLRQPTSQTNAIGAIRSYTYETNYNQKASITDELGRYTEFEFDEYGNRTYVRKYNDAGKGTLLSETEMEYGDARFLNFMTKQTVLSLSGDPSWATNLVTTYTAHDYGKVATKTVTVNGVAQTTTYDYDKNNNLTSVVDPNDNRTVNEYDPQNRLIKISFYEGETTLKCSKQFWYDLRGNKTWERDENGHYSYFEYDSRNNCTKTVRIMERRDLDPINGLVEYEAIPGEDIVVESSYNALGMLEWTKDARGLETIFEYDHLQRLTNTVVGIADPSYNPQITSYEYGTNSGGSVFSSSGFKPTWVKDPRGYVTMTEYDSLYRPVKTTAAIDLNATTNAVTMNHYDALGNLLVVSNQVKMAGADMWQITSTGYDELNRPTSVTNADETVVQMVYTSTGLKWKTIDEMDRVSTVEYDAAGRPVKTFAPKLADGSQAVTETGYDKNGNVWWVQDAEGNTSTNLYDYRNRVVQTIAPEVYDPETDSMVHPLVESLYDNVGNVVSVTDAEGNTTTNFYDANNRMVETWAPEVKTNAVSVIPKTVNEFDHGGNIILTRDANLREVEMQYDLFGRLTNTVDAIENTISFEYDENGNQIALIDGEHNRTEFEYDGLNRKTVTRYPEVDSNRDEEIAEYDLLGNRIKRIDCNGVETMYDYDKRNRLDYVSYESGHTRDYQYDDAGNLLVVDETPVTNAIYSSTNNADVAYTYDALNRVTSETSVGITHQYAYDLNGNRTNAVYGVSGRNVSWSYDALNRIKEIEEYDPAVTPQASNVTLYHYDRNSKPVYRQYPSGVVEIREFDPMGRLLTMSTTNLNISGDGNFAMAYEYDLVGSALKMTQTSMNLIGTQDAVTSWGYDDRYRLTNETVIVGATPSSLSTNATFYAWDNADNREQMVKYENGALVSTTTYTNNALNQMTGYEERIAGVSSATVVEFSYDANGSRTNKVESVGGTTSVSSYTYDEDNRLVNAALNSSTNTHTFAYDYRSRRYYRSTPTTPHMYCVFDGGLSIQEYTVSQASSLPSTSTLTTEFVRGEGMGGGVGGMVYSLKHDPNNQQSTTHQLICSHANHRGDVIARSDETRSLTSFALYEAYGTRPYEWSDGVTGDPDRQKANTKEEESDLGLLNEGMRFRDLETGVFLTRDPIGYGDGPNVYCYVHCNPITSFDPWGLNKADDDAEAALAAAQQAAEEAQAALEVAEKEAERANEAVLNGLKNDSIDIISLMSEARDAKSRAENLATVVTEKNKEYAEAKVSYSSFQEAKATYKCIALETTGNKTALNVLFGLNPTTREVKDGDEIALNSQIGAKIEPPDGETTTRNTSGSDLKVDAVYYGVDGTEKKISPTTLGGNGNVGKVNGGSGGFGSLYRTPVTNKENAGFETGGRLEVNYYSRSYSWDKPFNVIELNVGE